MITDKLRLPGAERGLTRQTVRREGTLYLGTCRQECLSETLVWLSGAELWVHNPRIRFLQLRDIMELLRTDFFGFFFIEEEEGKLLQIIYHVCGF